MKVWIPLAVIVLVFCGCIAQEKFTLTDIIFCASEPADRSYDQKHDPTYVPGETVWIYLEAFKFETREEGYFYVMSFDYTLEVYDEQGNYILGGPDHIEESSSEDPVYVWFRFWIETSGFEEGAYTVKIVMTDTFSKQSATSEGTFYLVKAGS